MPLASFNLSWSAVDVRPVMYFCKEWRGWSPRRLLAWLCTTTTWGMLACNVQPCVVQCCGLVSVLLNGWLGIAVCHVCPFRNQKKHTRVFPVHWTTAMPCWWAPGRARQLSMAATARVMWLCACVRYWPGRGLVCVCANYSKFALFSR